MEFFNRNPLFIRKKIAAKIDNKLSQPDLDKHFTSDYFVKGEYILFQSQLPKMQNFIII